MPTDDEVLDVLVIEDDDDIRRLLEVVLGQAGYVVTSAATGAEGLARAQELHPALITLDIGLPDQEGYAVAKQLREFYRGHLVMLTARSEPFDKTLGMEVGADAYITKPFRPRALRDALSEIMARDPRGAVTG